MLFVCVTFIVYTWHHMVFIVVVNVGLPTGVCVRAQGQCSPTLQWRFRVI